MKQYLILAVIAAILVGLWYVDKKNTRKETVAIVDSLYTAKKKIINYDSIKQDITKHVIDSMRPILQAQEKRLNLIKDENDKRHRDNQVRFVQYDSIVLDRPDL